MVVVVSSVVVVVVEESVEVVCSLPSDESVVVFPPEVNEAPPSVWLVVEPSEALESV